MEQLSIRYTTNKLRATVPIKEWLVRHYGEYSVAEMENGNFILVLEYENEFSLYLYDNFEDFAVSHGSPFEPPNSLIRAVALELGITEIWHETLKRNVVIADWFRSDEYDVLAGVKYAPRKKRPVVVE